jgi:hypothetical protein
MLDYDWKCKYNNRLSGEPSIGVEFARRQAEIANSMTIGESVSKRLLYAR